MILLFIGSDLFCDRFTTKHCKNVTDCFAMSVSEDITTQELNVFCGIKYQRFLLKSVNIFQV
jgi:hypothetical protein